MGSFCIQLVHVIFSLSIAKVQRVQPVQNGVHNRSVPSELWFMGNSQGAETEGCDFRCYLNVHTVLKPIQVCLRTYENIA